jgi:hypothetical protein
MTRHPQRLYACLMSLAAALCGASLPSTAVALPSAPPAAPRKDCIARGCRFRATIYAGSVFGGIDTVLGPLFLGMGHVSDGANAWYLTFGSLLRPRQ